ncbi:MAG: hypothetical protein ABSA49_08245 [Rhizomicrobium sp.]
MAIFEIVFQRNGGAKASFGQKMLDKPRATISTTSLYYFGGNDAQTGKIESRRKIRVGIQSIACRVGADQANP